MKLRSIILGCALFFAIFSTGALYSVSVGGTLSTVKIFDSHDNAAEIPYIGSKVITIMYTDPDVKDVNDSLSNAIKAKNFSSAKYQGIGIANCKDTWLPNAAIRASARKKEAQFPGSIIMIDPSKTVSSAWGLGNCDETGVVIIIGKDSKVKFLKKIKTKEDSAAQIAEVLKILETEIAK